MSLVKSVKVIANGTDQVLFETSPSNLKQAYAYAAQMDEAGIDVRLVAPTINETLALELGISEEDQMRLQDSIVDEIEDHDGSCCATPYQANE